MTERDREKWIQEFRQEIINLTGDKKVAEEEVKAAIAQGVVGGLSPKERAEMVTM